MDTRLHTDTIRHAKATTEEGRIDREASEFLPKGKTQDLAFSAS